jgi:integrase
MLPAVYDLLLEHKAEFDFGTHDPVFANRNGQRNTVDNVRRTIVETAVERANELVVARDQREIAHCTPHTLRRTFASILAQVNLPPRRAMYLLGHTDPTLTMRVYQQVIDMGDGGVQMLEKIMGCTNRRVLHTACRPRSSVPESSVGRKNRLPARPTERAGRRGNGLRTGTS